MARSSKLRVVHSSEYIRRILRTANEEDASRFKNGVKKLKRKSVHVTIESLSDEQFTLVSTEDSIDVVQKSAGQTDIALRISPSSFRRILEGDETPVEAFFFGHLRAKGLTRDLYGLHAFFLALAEIAVTSPKLQTLVEEFQDAKETS